MSALRWIFATTIFLSFLSPVGAADSGAGVDFFEKRIRPVLVEKCYRCHSAKAAEKKRLRGGLYLDSRAGIRKGGDTGPAVVPGEVGKSLILEALHFKNEDLQMPPSGKLPDRVLADFTKWIKIGAPDPRKTKVVASKYEIDIEEGRSFWSLRPLQTVMPPKVSDRWALGDIDRFVLLKLESKGLKPTEDAEPRELVRRIYIDLVGLPPTPDQIKEFVSRAAKDRRQAIEQLVDRLLASPRFGERWGRHWLDVARYGESNGGTKNTLWPDAWRYRTYVIDAFNDDKPFDRFVKEQLAGDLLPTENEARRQRQTVATAFLAMGSQPANAPRIEIIGEQLDVMGRAFLGISIGCARCHDHKFDPIPTRDFYAMAGVMLNTEISDDAALAKVDKKQRKTYKNFQRAVAKATREIAQARERLEGLAKQAEIRHLPWQDWQEVIAQLPDNRQSKGKQAFEQLEKGLQTLSKLRKNGPPDVHQALAARDRPARGNRFRNAKIHIRGSEKNLGDEVSRGVMRVLYTEQPPEIGERESGRLQMAEVIHRHPLVARVMVNRIWHHLFGRGLVRTVDNFGTLGERPSHPKLLEWLAGRFIEEDWSVKKTIRRIMLSRTYQLSAEIPDKSHGDVRTVDPGNVLLWRHSPRRLDAESIRDSILAASGMLDLTPPDRFDLLTYHTQMNDIRVMDGIHKRAVYLPVNRGVSTDVMAVFNFPPADLVVGRRETASVPTQGLFMLNSPLVIDHTQRMAKRLLDDDSLNDVGRITEACLWIWGRGPTEAETKEALAFIESYKEQNSKTPSEVRRLDAWAAYCQSLFCSAEFRFVR